MKRIVAILCAVMLLMTCSISVFAEGENPGSIEISNAKAGNVYTAYQIAVLESFSGSNYAYKILEAWEGFVAVGGLGASYLEIDADGYLVEKGDLNAEQTAALAKAALQYANGLQGVTAYSDTASEEGTLTISNLPLGYYVVDSTLGTICSLNTTDNVAEIEDKNEAPTIDKQVKEEGETDYGETTEAAIGDTVNFLITVNVVDGAVNYVVHDKMDDGLTFDATSVKVYDNENLDSLVANTNYTFATTNADNCTFEIDFNDDFIATKVDSTLYITYNAVLNGAARTDAAEENNVELTYGDSTDVESNIATTDPVEVVTFSFDLVKTDTDNKILNGSQFELYTTATGDVKVALVDLGNGEYRRALADDTTTTNTIIPVNGVAKLIGFDSDEVLYLKETVAPTGYNLLATRVTVEMTNRNNDATVENSIWTTGGVRVENKAGAVLPSTGGVGTTMFIVIGGLVALLAGIFFVTRVRMSKVVD